MKTCLHCATSRNIVHVQKRRFTLEEHAGQAPNLVSHAHRVTLCVHSRAKPRCSCGACRASVLLSHGHRVCCACTTERNGAAIAEHAGQAPFLLVSQACTSWHCACVAEQDAGALFKTDVPCSKQRCSHKHHVPLCMCSGAKRSCSA